MGKMEDAAMMQEVYDGMMEDVFHPLPEDSDEKPKQKSTNIFESMQLITCQPIGESKLWHYNCCLQRCCECPDNPPIRGEDVYKSKSSGDNVTWSQHLLTTRCSEHGLAVHADHEMVAKCPKCQKETAKWLSEKNPVVERKLDLETFTKPIGVFIRDYYLPF